MSTAPGEAPSVPSKLNRGIELCADEAMDIATQSAMMWQRIFRKPRFPTLPAFRLGLDARASSTKVLGFDIGKPPVSDSGLLLDCDGNPRGERNAAPEVKPCQEFLAQPAQPLWPTPPDCLSHVQFVADRDYFCILCDHFVRKCWAQLAKSPLRLSPRVRPSS